MASRAKTPLYDGPLILRPPPPPPALAAFSSESFKSARSRASESSLLEACRRVFDAAPPHVDWFQNGKLEWCLFLCAGALVGAIGGAFHCDGSRPPPCAYAAIVTAGRSLRVDFFQPARQTEPLRVANIRLVSGSETSNHECGWRGRCVRGGKGPRGRGNGKTDKGPHHTRRAKEKEMGGSLLAP